MSDRELLLFNIYKEQPITREKFAKIEKNNPDINFSLLKTNLINYQVEKYGIELKFLYDIKWECRQELHKKNANAQSRRSARFKAKEWH